MSEDLPNFYFDTEFVNNENVISWPSNFAIISAFSTTGEQWTDEKNIEADVSLQSYLDERFGWVRKVISFSPRTGHSEPSWAVTSSFDEACNVGELYKQDAIYYVSDNILNVSYCDDRRLPVPVGDFITRLHLES